MGLRIEPLTVAQVTKAVNGTLLYGAPDMTISAVSTDSRAIEQESLFIPLKGETFDGHRFIAQACQKGAAGYLCGPHYPAQEGSFAIRVSDSNRALLDLAHWYRMQFVVHMVGLTGSVGKTTTKELIASVLQQQFCTLKTQGNFNNEVGLPLTLLGLRREHQAAVIEMGMSHFGEIERLSRCAQPDTAVITNIGVSHIENLGSREGILRAKCEIFSGLSEHGTVFLNGDDHLLYGLRNQLPNAVFYGVENRGCDLVATDLTVSREGVSFCVAGEVYRIQLVGKHNVYAALAAIAVGQHYGMKQKDIKNGLFSYQTDGIRQHIQEKNGILVISDCYNASPQSVCAAIDVLAAVGKGRRKIAVLGDMAELGDGAPQYHRETGAYAASHGVDMLLLVGQYAQELRAGAASAGLGQIVCCADNQEINAALDVCLRQGDAILIKGSRVMKLEEVSSHLLDG